MLYRVVAVRDNAVEAFLSPRPVPHVGAAVREFTSACNDAQHDFCKHSSDFDLYELGEWEDTTGRFVSHQDPVRLCRGKDVNATSLPVDSPARVSVVK